MIEYVTLIDESCEEDAINDFTAIATGTYCDERLGWMLCGAVMLEQVILRKYAGDGSLLHVPYEDVDWVLVAQKLRHAMNSYPSFPK